MTNPRCCKAATICINTKPLFCGTEQTVLYQEFTVPVKDFRQIDLCVDYTASCEFFCKCKILLCFICFSTILIKHGKIVCADCITAFDQFFENFFSFIITTEHLIHFAISIFDCQVVPTVCVILNDSGDQSCIGCIWRIGKCFHSKCFVIFVKEKLIITQHPSAAGIGMDPEIKIISQIPDNVFIIKTFRHIRIHKRFYQPLRFLLAATLETGFIQTCSQGIFTGCIDCPDGGIGIEKIFPDRLFLEFIAHPTHITFTISHKIFRDQSFCCLRIVIPSGQSDILRMGQADHLTDIGNRRSA